MKQGDLVTRNSYGNDVIFKIEYMDDQIAVLRGIEFRLIADAPVNDLAAAEATAENRTDTQVYEKSMVSVQLLEQSRKQQQEQNFRELAASAQDIESFFEVPGKVLHLDGDSAYLQKSLNLYKQLNVPIDGHYVQEAHMADALAQLLPQVKPDIVVITGHDGMLKFSAEEPQRNLTGYKNSQHFVKAVKVARQFEKNRDTLTIIAGACQSHFEALLHAGANFASSPARILIHCLDPVHIAAKVSYTSVKETVNMVDVISHTVSGLKGIGGIESRGSYRIGLPNFTYKA